MLKLFIIFWILPYVTQASVLNELYSSTPKNYGYVTFGWHDTRIASIFVPIVYRWGENWIWWDTGTVIGGTSVGYRKMLHGTQRCVGIYGSYDVMYDASIRFAAGLEAIQRQHRFTFNGYGHTFAHGNPTVCDLGGMSIVYEYKRKFQTLFIGGHLSWTAPNVVGPLPYVENVSYSYANAQRFSSIFVGMQYSLNDYVSIELKKKKWDKSWPSIGLKVVNRSNNTDSVFLQMIAQPPRHYLPWNSTIISLLLSE